MENKKNFIYAIIMVIFVLTIICVSAIKYCQVQIMECVGENSKLFIQPGSKSCNEQIKLLGNKIKYFNVVNCFSERDKCSEIEISSTPAWIIKKDKIYKVYNLNKLKELTNC